MTALEDAAAVVHIMRRRVGELLRVQGVAGTAVHCARNIRCLPKRLGFLLREAAYDRKMGVQTSRQVAAADLGIDAGRLDGIAVNASGNAYTPTPAWALTAILEGLNIRHPDYNFIDLGSGMGRVVLMAAEFPFRKVVGVEFSAGLHHIAEDNLARRSGCQRAAGIDLVWQDAREYVFPLGNCIIYMFNPFREAVMRTVLENLRRSFDNQRAELQVIYFNPVLGALLDASSFLVKLKATRHYSIYSGTGQ